MEALHLLHAAFLRGHFSPRLDDWLCFGATEAARAQIANAVFDLGGTCEPGGAPETFYASGARLLAAIPRRAWEAERQQDRRRHMARMRAEYPQYFKPNGTLDIFKLVWVQGWEKPEVPPASPQRLVQMRLFEDV